MYFGEEKLPRLIRIVGDPNSFRTRSANHEEAAKAECTYGDTGRGCKQLKLRRGEGRRHTRTERERSRNRATERETERTGEMNGNEFRFFLSCDINLPVTFRIEALDGDPPAVPSPGVCTICNYLIT